MTVQTDSLRKFMRRHFKRYLPDSESLKQQRWCRHFGGLLNHHQLWHINRSSASGGLAVGLFCGMIPGPLQMAGAIIGCLIFRVNLPIALLGTLFSNPLTIVPLYFLAYTIGAWLIGHDEAGFVQPPSGENLAWIEWGKQLLDWMLGLGYPLLVGLPILAVLLAAGGYALVRLGWRIHGAYAWRKRGIDRRAKQG